MEGQKLAKVAYPYSGLCSTIGSTYKNLFADDDQTCRLSTLLVNTRFYEFTVKVQSLGTNTYIKIGNHQRRDMRFTAVNQSYTYEAPTIYKNGVAETILLQAKDFTVIGDGATGILEINGLEVIE